MKKYLLFVVYILSVAFLFFVIDRVAGVLFDRFFFLKNDTKLEHVILDKESEDIVILGASRAAHHYIPAQIEESLGKTCYNYGMDGRNIYNHYVIANYLLTNKINKPKLVILEAAYIDLEDTPGYNGEILNNLYTLYPKDNVVREIIDRENKYLGYSLCWINCFRYNSVLLASLHTVISAREKDVLKGYQPLFSQWKKDRDVSNKQGKSISLSKEEYFVRLIKLCSDNGVKLIVYNSPDYAYDSTTPPLWIKRLSEICDDNNICFINHAHDSLFMSHKEWFNEPFHLNNTGAIEYSSTIIDEIKDVLN